MAPDIEDLDEVFEEEIDDATVITVPIDATLSNSGEAADAKAVGDALAGKADRSELQTAVTVNGQSADAQGAILVNGTQIKMSGTDNMTVKAAIEAAAGRTGADIPVDNSQGAQTIKQALASGATRTADQIEMSADDDTTVKAAIETVAGDLDTAEAAIIALQGKTAADIKYQSGSNETVKEHVDAIDSGLVKTVYGVGPDADGDVSPATVPYADNLKTDEQEEVAEAFLERMTGGTLSISGANAWLMKMLGNRVHTGYTAESIEKTVTPMPRTAPAAITASLNKTTFIAYVEVAGTYELNYTTGWDHDPADYGVTVSNDPVDGDKITIVWDGENDPVLSVTAAARTAPPDITASVDRDTWVGYVNTNGTYTFTYSTAWKLSNTEVDLADYGITVQNTPIAGDEIVVVYVKEVRGTITVANPSALVASGWNLYNHTNGYARVLKYSNSYGYKIGGNYTAVKFAETVDGEQTTITPDADGLFTLASDGYVFVTGGNNTDTYILPTWSDWGEGYEGDFQAYQETSISVGTIMSANFPYGLCRVGDVRDEIDADRKLAISRISRTAYSDEARAAAAASGRAYEFDENYIYQVRATAVETSIEIEGAYAADDHGMEWFTGSTVAVMTETLYGQNLKDKLRRDVVTIRKQSFTDGQKAIARENIAAAGPADLSLLAEEIGIVVTGNKTAAGVTASQGQYVIVRNSTISGKPDGLYKAAQAIPAATAIDGTYLTAVPGGLGAEVASLNSKIGTNNVTATKIWANSIDIVAKQSGNIVSVSGYLIINASAYTDQMPLFSLSKVPTNNIYFFDDKGEIMRLKSNGQVIYHNNPTIPADTYRFINFSYATT